MGKQKRLKHLQNNDNTNLYETSNMGQGLFLVLINVYSMCLFISGVFCVRFSMFV